MNANNVKKKEFIEKHLIGKNNEKITQSSSSSSRMADIPPSLQLLTSPCFAAPGAIVVELPDEPATDCKSRRARRFTSEEKAFIVVTHDRLLNHTYFIAAKGHSIWDDTLAALMHEYQFDKAPHSDTMRNVVRAQRLGHV